MNTNLKRFLLCPIPEDQKPISLYQKMKENDWMNWTMWSQKQYQNRLFSLFLWSFGIGCFSSFSGLSNFSYLFEWILGNLLFSLTALILLLGVIFFRWKQVENAFASTKVAYEEGSWSDGQIWEKPKFIQTTDQLIQTQKLIPILQRITRSLYSLSCLAFFVLLLFEIL